jgi:AraC-like DNA-binding protein
MKCGLTSVLIHKQRMNLAPSGIIGRVRHTLWPLSAADKPLLQDTAGQLGLHPRRLQRILASEGNSFEAIRDDVRFAVAQELLALARLSVMEIEFSLGFASPSSFIHAFHRWCGYSLARWRQEPASL